MLARLAKRFIINRTGNFAVQGALAFTTIIVAAGFSFDYINASRYKSQLQQAADAAALAAARDSSLDDDEASELVRQVFVGNLGGSLSGYQPDIDTAVIRDTSGNGSTVSVNVLARIPTTLMRVARVEHVDVAAQSQARGSSSINGACVIALDPGHTNGAFSVSGAGRVEVPNCGIFVNSHHNLALRQQGGGHLHAKDIWVVGGHNNGKFSPAPETNQEVIADPLANVPEPQMPSGCTYENRSFSGLNTFPGGTVFCGEINFSGTVRFQGGIHFFKNAAVTTSSNSNIRSNGAMLYFDKDSHLQKSSGTGEFNLRAPASGPYRGIAVFGSRQSSGSIKTFEFYGNKDFKVHGAIYLPRAHWFMTGSTELNVSSENGFVIAWRLTYHGASKLTLDTFGGPAPVGMGEEMVLLVR